MNRMLHTVNNKVKYKGDPNNFNTKERRTNFNIF